jgi:hypothetical protein
MEYLVCYGTACGQDPTNPEAFYSCTMFRFDTKKGQYFAHHVDVNHLTNNTDNTRVVTLSEVEPIAYLHECHALKEQYVDRRMRDRYAKASMIAEMRQDPEIEAKMEIAIGLMKKAYNPYLNIYEHIAYNY